MILWLLACAEGPKMSPDCMCYDPPVASVDTPWVDFGQVGVARRRAAAGGSAEVLLSNRGPGDLEVYDLVLEVEAFDVEIDRVLVPAEHQARITITFEPQLLGPHEDTLRIETNDRERPVVEVEVVGEGVGW